MTFKVRFAFMHNGDTSVVPAQFPKEEQYEASLTFFNDADAMMFVTKLANKEVPDLYVVDLINDERGN